MMMMTRPVQRRWTAVPPPVVRVPPAAIRTPHPRTTTNGSSSSSSVSRFMRGGVLIRSCCPSSSFFFCAAAASPSPSPPAAAVVVENHFFSSSVVVKLRCLARGCSSSSAFPANYRGHLRRVQHGDVNRCCAWQKWLATHHGFLGAGCQDLRCAGVLLCQVSLAACIDCGGSHLAGYGGDAGPLRCRSSPCGSLRCGGSGRGSGGGGGVCGGGSTVGYINLVQHPLLVVFAARRAAAAIGRGSRAVSSQRPPCGAALPPLPVRAEVGGGGQAPSCDGRLRRGRLSVSRPRHSRAGWAAQRGELVSADVLRQHGVCHHR